jgi:hypothetical protein
MATLALVSPDTVRPNESVDDPRASCLLGCSPSCTFRCPVRLVDVLAIVLSGLSATEVQR